MGKLRLPFSNTHQSTPLSGLSSHTGAQMRARPTPPQLRRMRLVATGLLLVMACLFWLAHQQPTDHMGWGYVLAFAEAGMVGGLADWFAVTALFRHPLGVPVPHTAIIPGNKDRIADSMAGFLREYFLTPAVVARRMQSMNLAASAGNFLVNHGQSSGARLRDGAAGLLADTLHALDAERIGELIKEGARAQLARMKLAPLLGQIMAGAIADRRHLPVLDGALRWAWRTLEKNEKLVRVLVRARANRLLRLTGIDQKIANAVLDGLYKLLAECAADPAHPLRRRVERSLEKLAHDLQHDAKMHARVESMKQELLANPAIGHWLDGLWQRARAALIRAGNNPESALSTQAGAMLEELGEALRKDAHLQALINRFARRIAVGVTQTYGHGIVRLVSDTVKRWDAHIITQRIEHAVGRDLQFIRINGTLVGGLIGVVIHTFGHFM